MLPLLVAALPLLLAGCTGTDRGASGDDPARGAGARPAANVTVRDAAALGDLVLRAAVGAGSVTFRTTFDGLPAAAPVQESTGAMTFDARSSSARVTTGAGTVAVEQVAVPAALYLRATGPSDSRWSRLPAGPGFDPFRTAFGATADLLQWSSDPSATRALLRRSTLTANGPVQVDGVAVTRYLVDVPAEAYVGTQPSPSGAGGIDATVLANATVRIESLVDGDGLVRRSVVTVTAGTWSSVGTVTYSGWGEPVTVEEPDPKDVAA